MRGNHAGEGEGEGDAGSVQKRGERPAFADERGERQTRHHGRQREREQHQ
ncbi:hypothetical protein [Corynebacterium aquatimens]